MPALGVLTLCAWVVRFYFDMLGKVCEVRKDVECEKPFVWGYEAGLSGGGNGGLLLGLRS